MKVLVTGGGGFLGSAIVRRLLGRGVAVRVVGRQPQPTLVALGVEVLQGDLVDLDVAVQACRGMDAVVHTAAKAGVWGSWESFYSINVLGTRNLLEACRECGVRWMVHTSTPSVVFNGEAFCGADESLPYGKDWLCHYAQTKALAEAEVLKAHAQQRLATTALRPHLIWGVGDPHLLPRVIARAAAGRLRVVGEGQNRVDMTHVENAALAHLQALDALQSGRAGGRAYFISDGRPVMLWPWIETLLRRLEITMPKGRLSLRQAYALGAVLETLFKALGRESEPPMTRFVATELAKDHWFHIGAARRDLGYVPSVSPEEGLEAVVAEWRQRLGRQA